MLMQDWTVFELSEALFTRYQCTALVIRRLCRCSRWHFKTIICNTNIRHINWRVQLELIGLLHSLLVRWIMRQTNATVEPMSSWFLQTTKRRKGTVIFFVKLQWINPRFMHPKCNMRLKQRPNKQKQLCKPTIVYTISETAIVQWHLSHRSLISQAHSP